MKLRITNVTASNFKGGDVNADLAEATVIIGISGGGKNRVTDAIRLAVVGHLSELGKSLQKTSRLMSANETRVTVNRLNDTPITRTLKKKMGKDGETVSQSISPKDYVDPEPILFDCSEWLGQSENERNKFIFGLVDVKQEGDAEVNIVTAIKNISFDLKKDGRENSLATMKFVSQYAEEIQMSAEARGRTDETLQDWIETTYKTLVESLKTARSSAARFTKTVLGMNELSAPEMPQNPNAEIDLVTAKEKLNELSTARATAVEKKETATRNQTRRNAINTQLTELNRRVLSLEAKDHCISRPARIAELEQLQASVTNTPPYKSQTAEISGTLSAAKQRLETLKADDKRITGDIANMRGELEKLKLLPSLPSPELIQQQINPVKAEVEAYKSKTAALLVALGPINQKKILADKVFSDIGDETDHLNESFAKDSVLPHCPCCERKGVAWVKALTEKHERVMAELKAKSTAAWQAKLAADSEYNMARECLHVSQADDARIALLKDGLEKLREELREALAANQTQVVQIHRRDNLPSAIESAEAELAKVQQMITNEETVIGKNEKRLTASKVADSAAETERQTFEQNKTELNRLKGEESTQAQLQAELANLGAANDAELIAAAETAVAAHTAQQNVVSSLEADCKIISANRAAAATKAQAIEQQKDAEAEVDVLKKAVEIVQAEQAELIKKAFKPLLDRANAVASIVLPGPLEYHNNEIGYLSEGSWVSNQTLSGAEKRLVYAGISVALGARLVILDELGTIDPVAKRKVVTNMNKLKAAGIIDQWIGLDVTDRDYSGIEGLTFLKI